MKALKVIPAALVILVLTILVGCSDSLISPQEVNLKNTGPVKTTVEDGLPVIIPAFHTQLRLKPYRSYKFNLSNTGLSKFFSIEVTNIVDPNIDRYVADCQGFIIYENSNTDYNLGCHSKRLNIKEFTIENTTSGFLDLDVSLTGIKPVVKQITNEE